MIYYIRLSSSSRVFNLDCRFDPMVGLSCKAKQFLELMVSKEAMSWVGSMTPRLSDNVQRISSVL